MLINFALFQIGWFACVLGAAANHSWIGPVFVALPIVVELRRVSHRSGFLLVVALVTCLGSLADTILTAEQVLVFADGGLRMGNLPLWMIALWALFATTLTGCMRWLQGRPWLAAILGAVVGPLCYAGGQKLGALELGPDSWWLALEWAVLLPSAAWAARRLAPAPEGISGSSGKEQPAALY